ncbi:hypothetical protein STEG23_030832 [Scotinomys teguina]
MAPAKKGGEKKKGHSAINEVVTQEYTINIHKHIHGVGFKKRAPRALKEIQKFDMKEMGTPDVRIDTRLNKTVWAKGIRNVPYCIVCDCPENKHTPAFFKVPACSTSEIRTPPPPALPTARLILIFPLSLSCLSPWLFPLPLALGILTGFQAFSSSPCPARVQGDSNSNRSDYQVSLDNVFSDDSLVSILPSIESISMLHCALPELDLDPD